MGIRKLALANMKTLKAVVMNYNLFHNTMLILSGLHLNDLNPKDTTKAKFIKYFNDKTVVLNNQIITGWLLLRTHRCKHCQARGSTV